MRTKPAAAAIAEPKVVVLITTYDRPDQYHATLQAIAREGGVARIIAVQDGGEQYAVNETVLEVPVTGILKRHGGKRFYWHTVNKLWLAARKAKPDLVVQLPDDYTLRRGWLDRIIARYYELGGQGVLNIMPCHRQRQWRIERELVGDVYHNAFIDGAFITTREVMDRLEWRVMPVVEAWHRPGRSSGVWAQITRRLKRMGVPMFQLRTSPVSGTFDPTTSKMNPDRKHEDHLQGHYR